MNLQEAIDYDNRWKELCKKAIENNNNFNDFQKEILKVISDYQHECNKQKYKNSHEKEELIKKLLEQYK